MELQSATFIAGSFRDRSARVFAQDGQIYRALGVEAAAVWDSIQQAPFFLEASRQQQLVLTREVTADERARLVLGNDAAKVLWHERVPFIAYPYEWSFGMLKDAALLQLKILDAALCDGVMLKDATPYNVQFIGARPTFIDIGSFQTHELGEPWAAYQQFCELFLYPLMLQAYRGLDFQSLLRSELEGISAEDFAKLFSFRDWFRRGVFSRVILQAALAGAAKTQTESTLGELKKTGFPTDLIHKNVAKLTSLIQALKWEPRRSMWSNYDTTSEMVARDSELKATFVKDVSEAKHWELVWDLGCNRGRYSLIAAESAKYVLAMDYDHQCVEAVYQKLKQTGPKNVLPLRLNLANSSPALGWRGRERLRLEDRGRPDLVLCLGLIHHLVIAANIPLDEVIDWLASLKATVVIEFPTKRDPMVQALLRNKRDQYAEYEQANFERLLGERFTVGARQQLPSGERWIYRVNPLA